MAKCPFCKNNNNYPSNGLCETCYKKLLKEKQQAADWLINRDELRSKHLQDLEEFNDLQATSLNEKFGSNISMPTENKAIKLQSIHNDGLWLMAVNDVEIRLDKKRKKLLDLRRKSILFTHNESGRPGWIDYVQANWQEDFFPSRQALFKWWADIVNETVRMALLYRIL